MNPISDSVSSISESSAPGSLGHVTINERDPSSRFNRFVDERIKDWMRDHLDDLP